MPQSTHHDFDPQVLVLFDAYVHGDLDRRGFLQRAGQLVGATAALSVLGALSPRFAQARQVAEDDQRLSISRPEFDSP